MKKLFLLLALAGLSTGAFASKARLEAFGESKYGSFVLDDYRNIYLNIAAINNYKNYATIELGNTTVASDSTTSPKGEAGVTIAHGDMVFGLHYGYFSDALNSLRSSVLGAGDLTNTPMNNSKSVDISAQNVFDLMLGSTRGDMKWGAALQVSTSKDETGTNSDMKQTAIATRFGIIKNKLRIGAIVALANKVELDSIGYDTNTTSDGYEVIPTDVEFKGKFGFELNTSYDLNKNYRLFNKIQYQNVEGTNAILDEVKVSYIELGSAKTYHFSKTNFMFMKLAATYKKTELTVNSTHKAIANGAGVYTGNKKEIYLPFSLGVEGQAAEWLMLRASAKMNLYESIDADVLAGKKTGLGTVALNTGASLIFGDLNIDGYVGTTATDGVVDFTNLMTRVSMTYNF